MELIDARRTARPSSSGELVTLDEQDRVDLLQCLGCSGESRVVHRRAISLTGNFPERETSPAAATPCLVGALGGR